jgi:hypothetical protein
VRGFARYAADTGGWLHRGDDKWEPFDYAVAVAQCADVVKLATEDTIARVMNNAEPGAEESAEIRVKRHNGNVLKISGTAGRTQVVKTCTATAMMNGESVNVKDLDSDGVVIWAGGKCYDIRTGKELPDRVAYVHLLSAAYSPVARPHPKFSVMCEALFPDPVLRAWAVQVMARCYHGQPSKYLI